jgi:hypothetical protein
MYDHLPFQFSLLDSIAFAAIGVLLVGVGHLLFGLSKVAKVLYEIVRKK